MNFVKIFTFLIVFLFISCENSKKSEFSTNQQELSVQVYEFEPIYIYAQNKKEVKTKFYNFDDLLINGEFKKPQLLYIDTHQKIKFEKLLKLKKDFLPKLKNTSKDPVLR